EDLTVTAGGGAPDARLNLTVIVNSDGTGSVHGVFTTGTLQPSIGTIDSPIPVKVKCEPDDELDTFTFAFGDAGGIVLELGGGQDPRSQDIPLPPQIVAPPAPTRSAHEVVK